MQVLKITAEGLTTSFRYPFFMQGVQPTFEMPPPSTLYGHIASALGEWFDPKGVQFAIVFRYGRKMEEMEHTHILTPATGKLPGTGMPKVLEGKVNPFRREILFLPEMVLYVNRPGWAEAFRHPRYAVALGRSQDLFTYTDVQVLELQQSDHAYFEHTLAPFSFARMTPVGFTVLMPRFLDYARNRFPTFGRYVVIHRRVHSRDFIRFEGEKAPSFWIDPTSEEVEGDRMGLPFHTWVSDDESSFGLA